MPVDLQRQMRIAFELLDVFDSLPSKSINEYCSSTAYQAASDIGPTSHTPPSLFKQATIQQVTPC